jgi:NAD(P)-dependent dehydrogenase (short-subunit alcohol dehydrogenase family)
MQDSVLITGGAQRLGRELVLAFARAGWHVWCHYGQSADAARSLQTELRAQGLAAVRGALERQAADALGEAMLQELQALPATTR